MPALSLVVCVHKERDLLERLLTEAQGCYDDLVVVHDGPEGCDISGSAREAGGETEPRWRSPEELSLAKPNVPPPAIARDYAELTPAHPLPAGYRLLTGTPVPRSIHEIVARLGGRFYEGPRCFQQEPHWPFAWSVARHDWILRLDADEYPEASLKEWLLNFCMENEGRQQTSGFTCIWPLWDGKKMISSKWPEKRFFLFNKKRVKFFGMAEQSPIPEFLTNPTNLILVHAPKRKSFGLVNVLQRNQAYRWRSIIAMSLFHETDRFPRWNWNTRSWPCTWEKIRRNPLKQAFSRVIKMPIYETKYLWRIERKFLISAILSGGINHFLICFEHAVRKFLK
jgi:hypothetical protein